MGDISAEPSMEDILSSIKRIIAEEGDAPVRSRRGARTDRTAQDSASDGSPDDVLELSEPAPIHDTTPAEPRRPAPAPVAAAPAPTMPATAIPAPEPLAAPPPARPAPPDPRGDAIVSPRATEATRAPLEALTRLIVKPDIAGSDTLEGLVRELLRPMLREWLDAHLPDLVEQMVAREIERITGR